MNKIRLSALSKGQQKVIFISVLYWLSSFYFERFAFEPGAAAARPFTYIMVKLLTLLTIYAIISLFADAFSGRREKNASWQTIIYALPMFVVVCGFWAVSNAWPMFEGDQYNILNAAYNYDNMGGFFNYLTTYVFMIAMNIVPVRAFSVVFKIFAVSIAVGYCIFRLRRIWPSKLAFLLYAPFLIPPGFYLSYNIHRAPMYAVVYMLFSCLILCDNLEGKSLTKWKFIGLSFVIAVITQWRSEGIYLLVFAPVLLCLCYKPTYTKRTAALALAVMLVAQLIVHVPQSLEGTEGEDVTGGRTMPLFEYLITNMERKGLDKEKNAEDLALVDKYLSLDAIHELNETYGDYCYNDNLIIYSGRVHGASMEDIENFKSAVIRIVIRNPFVYIRTQLGAWSYISTANYYERKLDIISNIFTDLYVPTAWLLGLWVFLLIKKQWCFWFMTSCHLAHMCITTALLPASYFKYYYSEYLFAVLSALIVLLLYLKKRDQRHKMKSPG